MSSTAPDDQARRWTEVLEDSEARRSGVTLPDARRIVAGRLKVAPGKLERTRKGRVKGVAAWWLDKLRDAVVAELRGQLSGIEHDLAIARASGVRNSDDAFCAAAAAVENAKRLLREWEGLSERGSGVCDDRR